MIPILLLITCAPPNVEAELQWAEDTKWAVVHHIAGTEKLGGAEVLRLREEAIQRLRSPYVPCRYNACFFLKHFGTANEVPELIRATRDPQDWVAGQACLALASRGDKKVIPALKAAYLRDGSWAKQYVIVGLLHLAERTGCVKQSRAALERFLRTSINAHDKEELRKALLRLDE